MSRINWRSANIANRRDATPQNNLNWISFPDFRFSCCPFVANFRKRWSDARFLHRRGSSYSTKWVDWVRLNRSISFSDFGSPSFFTSFALYIFSRFVCVLYPLRIMKSFEFAAALAALGSLVAAAPSPVNSPRAVSSIVTGTPFGFASSVTGGGNAAPV